MSFHYIIAHGTFQSPARRGVGVEGEMSLDNVSSSDTTFKRPFRRDTFRQCRATICIRRLARVYLIQFSSTSLDSF